jgi:hypothetical protein
MLKASDVLFDVLEKFVSGEVRGCLSWVTLFVESFEAFSMFFDLSAGG